MIFDVAQLLTGLVGAWRNAKTAHAWMRLTFSMVFSATVAYYGTAGAAILAGRSELEASGAGYVAVAASLLGLFLRSNLTRKMSISVPGAVMKELHDSSTLSYVEKN